MDGIRVAKHDPNRTDENAALTRRPMVARKDLHPHDIGTMIEALRADGITSLNGLTHAIERTVDPHAARWRWQATSLRNLL